MSPNSNHHFDSYQHCDDDHESMNLVVGVGNDNCVFDSKGSVVIDDIHAHRRKHRSLALFPFLVTALVSLGIGWCASRSYYQYHSSDHQAANAGSITIDDEEEGTHAKDDNAAATTAASTKDIPDLIWSDEFDGDSIDLTKWTFVNGNGCDVGLCGWGNNELEWYTPSNAHVSDGTLTITARKFITEGGPPSYTSAKIVSRGKADFGVVSSTSSKTATDGGDGDDDTTKSRSGTVFETSRRFEARLKLPWGQGIWPAFWMLPTYDTYGGWPKSGEIDIMENIGKEGPNTVHGTVHYGLAWPQHQYSESGITLATPTSSPLSNGPHIGNLNETFHTYAVERVPGRMRWYIDDIEYSSITKEDMEPYHWSFDEDFYFILNLAVGGNWPGNPFDESTSEGDATMFPQRLEVDYVRVYEGTFPRIEGKSVVDCLEKNVVYEITNVEAPNLSYTWTVPPHATIKEGQGTSRIIVSFDSTTVQSNIIDSEIINVKAKGLDKNGIISTGLLKLLDNGIGTRVKITDFNGQCILSSNNKTTPEFKEYNFDCGRPLDCNAYVLHRTTEEFTCGERIEWLIYEEGMEEKEACKEVAYVQFHGHCGPCNPLD